MTKEELKEYLASLKLDNKLQDLLFELVDGATDVNNELIEQVSSILDHQSNFYKNLADIKKEEAAIYENLEDGITKLEDEYVQKSQQIVAEAQDELANDINQQVDKLKSSMTAQNIDSTRQEINAAGAQQNNIVNTEDQTQQNAPSSEPSTPTTSTQ